MKVMIFILMKYVLNNHIIEAALAKINSVNKFLVVFIKRNNKILIPNGKTKIKQDDILVICKKEFLGFVDNN